MSSEPRQRRAFRLPLPQEVAWKGALEATSHAVLGGLRHIRREAAKKQNQVAEAIDHVRREAGHRLQNCLSHLERPISSAPAFATISGNFRPNLIGELALGKKDLEKKLFPVFVYIVVHPDKGLMSLSSDEKFCPGSFVFLNEASAHEMIKKIKKKYDEYEDVDLEVGIFPLSLIYESFLKKRRFRRKQQTFFFVPDRQEVYYAAKLIQMQRNEEIDQEEYKEMEKYFKKAERELKKAEKRRARRAKKKKDKDAKESVSETSAEEQTESPLAPPPEAEEAKEDGVYEEAKEDGVYEEAKEDGVYEEAKEDGVYEEAEEDGIDKEAEEKERQEREAEIERKIDEIAMRIAETENVAELSQEELASLIEEEYRRETETPWEAKYRKSQEKELEDIIIKGVPVYACTGLLMGDKKAVPYFMSYRDLDCFMRATAKNSFKRSLRTKDVLNEHYKKAEDTCRKQLKKLKGEEAEHVRKVLKHIEAYRSMALLEHYYFPEKMSNAANIEVTDLESLMEKLANMRPEDAAKVKIFPRGSFYKTFDEEEDNYDELAALMERERKMKKNRSSAIIPDFLLN